MLDELKLVKDILTNKFEIGFISKEKLCSYVLKNGVSNLYTGRRIDDYSATSIVNTSKKGNTLFRHSSNDYYYYDLLDNDKRCEMIYPGAFYLENACTYIKPVYDKNIIKKR